MPRGRKPRANEAMKSLPFGEDDVELDVETDHVQSAGRLVGKADPDALWWNGKEIASVFKTRGIKASPVTLKKAAVEMGLKDEAFYFKGKPAHYTFTDVQMLQRELLRLADERRPRDSHEMCKLLSKMLDEADNGKR